MKTAESHISIEQVCELTGWSLRTAKRRLADVPREMVRLDRSGRGRPRKLYSVWAHPAIRAGRSGEVSPSARALTADDLATAQLRAQAVADYEERCAHMTEAQAAIATCSDWACNPRRRTVRIDERIGRKTVRRNRDVRVGGFKPRTLRNWASIYIRKDGGLAALAPQRKKRAGRPQKNVPGQLLDLVQSLSTSTARADIAKAIRRAREVWPGEWPDCSDDTIRRRIRDRDPHRRFEALGKHSVQKFRAEHRPDIMRDWSRLAFNERWELDDFREDWYAHASDIHKIMRPYAYGIMRVDTRQWIWALVTETPITQVQVRSMVGLAMAASSCGMPGRITFERGTVARDSYLENLLDTLGVASGQTSMDGGKVHAGALPDRAKGHFQGKGVIERNIRSHHMHNWDQPSQVGPDEEITGPARVQTLKRMAAKAAKDGRPLMLPDDGEYHRLAFQALERHNNAPHSALPKTVDLESGKPRHMSPNEYALSKRDASIRVMDSALLPLFFDKGVRCPVTRNGVKLNNQWYGWADKDLLDLPEATVYALPEHPAIAYCTELGRCIEAYQKPKPGSQHDHFERSAGVEKKYRNQYEALMARAAELPDAMIEQSRSMADPVPDRRRELVCPEPLKRRATAIADAVFRHREDDERHARRFDFPSRQAEKPRESLADRTRNLEDQVAVLTGAGGREEKDPFDI